MGFVVGMLLGDLGVMIVKIDLLDGLMWDSLVNVVLNWNKLIVNFDLKIESGVVDVCVFCD